MRSGDDDDEEAMNGSGDGGQVDETDVGGDERERRC